MSKSLISFGLTEITCACETAAWLINMVNMYTNTITFIFEFGFTCVFIPVIQQRGAGTTWQMVLSWKDVHKMGIRMC